jgi:hypothetical protein
MDPNGDSNQWETELPETEPRVIEVEPDLDKKTPDDMIRIVDIEAIIREERERGLKKPPVIEA